MANTYTRIYYHVVFSVKHRSCKFSLDQLDSVFEIMRLVFVNEDNLPIIVGGYTDHLHALISVKPKYALSDIISKVKSKSNKWLKDKKIVEDIFEWQVGYGAFTISHNDLDSVCQYIRNQKSHHETTDFKEEYRKMLRDSEIEFDEKYLFDL